LNFAHCFHVALLSLFIYTFSLFLHAFPLNVSFLYQSRYVSLHTHLVISFSLPPSLSLSHPSPSPSLPSLPPPLPLHHSLCLSNSPLLSVYYLSTPLSLLSSLSLSLSLSLT